MQPEFVLAAFVELLGLTDEDFVAAVEDAQGNLGEDEELTFIEGDLSPNTIERIRNANFEVIQYRIA